MVSYGGELYLYGGLPISCLLEEAYLDAYQQEVDYMNYIMRLDKVTHLWEIVGCPGAPTGSGPWCQPQGRPTGAPPIEPPCSKLQTSLVVFAGLCYSLVYPLLVLQVLCTRGSCMLLGGTVGIAALRC